MKNVAAVLDTGFYFIAGFFLSFVFVNYAVPRPASYVLSATFAIIFTVFAVKFSINRKKSRKFSAEKEQKFNAVMTKLNLSGDKSVSDLFEKALKAEGFAVEKKRGGLNIAAQKKTVFLKFGFDGVNKTEIVKCFNKIPKDYKAEIYSETFTDAVTAFAARFGGKIVLSDGEKAFALLEKNGLLPATEFTLKEENVKPSLNFKRLLDKKRAKNYLVFGILFILLSYVVPIKGYYLVFGAVFLIFSLIIRLFGKTAA